MSDLAILDQLDWSPPCICGHDQGEHATDGCIMYEPLKWSCRCSEYRPGVEGEAVDMVEEA